MLCIVAIVDCTHVHHVVHYEISYVAIVACTHVHHVVHYKISYVDIVDSTQVRLATTSLEDMLTFHRRTLQKYFDSDQLQPPLDKVTVDQERDFHKPNT